jgi:hypothetical protein
MVSAAADEVRMPVDGSLPLRQRGPPYQEPPAWWTTSWVMAGRPMMLSNPSPAERIAGSCRQ